MTQIQGSAGTPGFTGHAAGHAEPGVVGRLGNSLERLRLPEMSDTPSLRYRISEIGDRAREVQIAAGTAHQAIDTLTAVEQALVFALDPAREARDARSLPEAALSEMQKQVDLAINAVDGLAGAATFAGQAMFDGSGALGVSSRRLELPRVSSQTLGAAGAGAVDYSRSVASAGNGGPNSLTSWADGAVTVIEGGLEQVRRMRDAIDGFYTQAVLPAVTDIDVMLANALATNSRADKLDDAISLLAGMAGDVAGGASEPLAGDSVVRLLD